MGLFLFFTLTSCNDWFEVSPETQVSSDDLYEKGNGFRMQVNGLYKSLGSSSLYAQELTWGFLDVLGQYYIRQNLDNAYQEVNDRQYENANGPTDNRRDLVGNVQGYCRLQQYYRTRG